MANTYTKIASVTVGAGGSSTIDFSSIPSTYTDLLFKLSLRADTNSGTYQQLSYRFNANTSSYAVRDIEGNGSAAGSGNNTTNTPGEGGTWGRLTSTGINIPSTTASTFTSFDWYIPNYTVAQYKSFGFEMTSENNATQAYQEISAGLWSNTTAINQVTITPFSGNFAQYSTATLYGISNT